MDIALHELVFARIRQEHVDGPIADPVQWPERVRIPRKVTGCSAVKLPLVPGKVTTRPERGDAVVTL